MYPNIFGWMEVNDYAHFEAGLGSSARPEKTSVTLEAWSNEPPRWSETIPECSMGHARALPHELDLRTQAILS